MSTLGTSPAPKSRCQLYDLRPPVEVAAALRRAPSARAPAAEAGAGRGAAARPPRPSRRTPASCGGRGTCAAPGSRPASSEPWNRGT